MTQSIDFTCPPQDGYFCIITSTVPYPGMVGKDDLLSIILLFSPPLRCPRSICLSGNERHHLSELSFENALLGSRICSTAQGFSAVLCLSSLRTYRNVVPQRHVSRESYHSVGRIFRPYICALLVFNYQKIEKSYPLLK